MGEHQLTGLTQWHGRFDRHQRLPCQGACCRCVVVADARAHEVEVRDHAPHAALRRLVRDTDHRNAVNMVRGHDLRNLGQARVGLASEDAGMHGVGHSRVVERWHQIATAIRLCVRDGHRALLGLGYRPGRYVPSPSAIIRVTVQETA